MISEETVGLNLEIKKEMLEKLLQLNKLNQQAK